MGKYSLKKENSKEELYQKLAINCLQLAILVLNLFENNEKENEKNE